MFINITAEYLSEFSTKVTEASTEMTKMCQEAQDTVKEQTSLLP